MKNMIYILLFVSNNLNAQTYSVKKDNLLTYLYNSKGFFEEINMVNPHDKAYLPIKIGKNVPEQKIIKTNKGLYIQIDGTGQIYKATSSISDKIVFTKIDSTIYFGHNFGSIKFSYLDTIYNFGGNGYWHFFGHLIYFNEGKEWEIKKLNEENISNSSIHYLNSKKGVLFYIQKPYKDVSTIQNVNEFKLVKLDLKVNKSEIIGNINNNYLKYNELKTYIYSNKLNGIICQFQSEFFLLNFERNEILKLINTSLIKELNGSANSKNEVFFEKNGIIYIGTGNDRDLKQLKILLSDFEKTDFKIYNKNYSTYYIIIFIIISILLSLFFFKYKYIKSKFNNIIKGNINIKNELEFNEVEKAVIDLLIYKSDKNEFCDSEDLNKVFGLAKKSLDVQKKLRTEYIHRINHKFKINYNIDKDFIERHKTEEDRRFLKYGISKENCMIYKNNKKIIFASGTLFN